MNQIEFINIVEPFKSKMFRLAVRLLVSTEEAEDATQEVLIKLWNKNSLLQKFGSIEAYAMTITKNYCLDVLKSKRASNIKIIDNYYVEKDAGLQQRIEDKNTYEWLEKCINELPEQQKMIVQMRDIEQYDFAEISQIMDMSEATIRVSLSRARKTIREKLMNINRYGIE